jgi:hypothetical protein
MVHVAVKLPTEAHAGLEQQAREHGPVYSAMPRSTWYPLEDRRQTCA